LSSDFFASPILNSPYEPPTRHWQLVDGQPTGVIEPGRRRSDLTTPIPKARTTRGKSAAVSDLYADAAGEIYDPTEIINGIRSAVESWRSLPESQWRVTPTTARLLRHWRTHPFANQRPFFCQIEAVETIIWLTEVAPKRSSQGQRFWAHLEAANVASNPELMRMALKLATGAGKTTVMAIGLPIPAQTRPSGNRGGGANVTWRCDKATRHKRATAASLPPRLPASVPTAIVTIAGLTRERDCPSKATDGPPCLSGKRA
jgi:hypothetical protein